MKKPTTIRLMTLLMAACTVGLGLSGCQTTDTGTEAPATAEAPATQPMAEIQPVPAAETAPAVEVKPAAEPAKTDVVVAPAAPDAAALRAAQIDYLVGRAKAKLASGELVDARASVNEVLALDANNADAKALKSQIDALVAAPKAAPSGAGSAEYQALSTLSEYLVEAGKIQNAAKAAEAAGDWTEAERQYSRLRQLIQYSPYKAEIREKYEALTLAGLKNAEVNKLKEKERDQLAAQETKRRENEIQELAREQRKKEEIVELWRKALYNLELKRYNTAQGLVGQILNLDRNFRQAEELRDDIESMRLENMRSDAFERKVLGYRYALLELKMAMVPETNVVNYPGGRLAQLIRERKDNLPDAVRGDKAAVAAQAALDARRMKRLDAGDPGRPFGEIVKEISAEAGVPILVEENLKANVVSNLELTNVSCSTALAILCEQQPDIQRVFANGVVQIVTKASTTRDEYITRVHDIRDITYQLQNFQAPVLNLRSNKSAPPILIPTTELAPTTDEVTEFIKAGLGEGKIEDNQMVLFGGQLVVTQTAAIQAQIRDFLKDLRKVAGLLVAMEARFITVQDDFLSDFGIDFRGLGGPSSVPNQANLTLEDINSNAEDNAGGAFDNGNLGVPTANPSAGIFFNNANPRGQVNFNRDIRGRFENIFDNALGSRLSGIGGLAMQVAIFRNLTQINAVIQAVQKQGKARTLVSPRLSAYNTQRSNIAIINQVPYIRDFEPQSAASSAIANPVLDTILDGIVLEVVPTISNDRRFITIEVQPTVAELLLPIPTFVTTLGPSSAVTIQIPELRIQSAKTTVRVPDGGAVVIGGMKSVRDIDVEMGTPILMDLPLIGVLFRRKGRDIEQSNLVVVIKAHVVDLNDEELRQPGWH
jgi:type II secretory pathway component GspD/PulD (secretin)